MRIGSRPTPSAEDISSNVKAFVDKLLDAEVAETLAQRGREIAAAVGDATGAAVDRAGETWKDTADLRADAMKNMKHASDDAARWSARTWRRELRPLMRDLWKRRTVALGAAGAAIPAGRGLVDTAAQRIGLKQREERHWGAFFFGMILGAAAGVIAALLTAPKRGSELREELTTKAQAAAETVGERAQEIAGEWVPLFQRDGIDAPAASMEAGDTELISAIDADAGIDSPSGLDIDTGIGDTGSPLEEAIVIDEPTAVSGALDEPTEAVRDIDEG